ncbi:hypothetical protein EMUCRT_0495 [Ehrlichia cf. muris str. EmCRT]|uniref:Uncharacterized protein n=1 Tax=Ehrlichia cf. muris str. EmCRT TaxID=1359167 RepID=A0A0F3NC02_9RICK|nr:hypothetical protein EMUCRT_0495 [Ehrlichia cf. muris str. EmCRT]
MHSIKSDHQVFLHIQNNILPTNATMLDIKTKYAFNIP